MKKIKFIVSFTILCVLLLSCKKAEIQSSIERENIETINELWRTPSGIVIPYSEKKNWKEYLKKHYNESKIGGYQYISNFCTTPSIKKGTECTSSKNGDCTNAFSCTTCGNC